jgi:hypothetical protein
MRGGGPEKVTKELLFFFLTGRLSLLPDHFLCAVSLPISALLAFGTRTLLAVALSVDTTMAVSVLTAAGLELDDFALAVVLLSSPAAGRSPHTFLGGESSSSNE